MYENSDFTKFYKGNQNVIWRFRVASEISKGTSKCLKNQRSREIWEFLVTPRDSQKLENL